MDDDTRDWFRSRRTMIRVLRRRGYEVDDSVDYPTLEDFVRDCGTSPPSEDKMAIWLPVPGMVVYFCTAPKALGIAHMRALARITKAKGMANIIIVSVHGITTSANSQMLDAFRASKTRVRTFLRNELLVDIFEHVNMPRVRILAEEEWRALLPVDSAKLLPKILRTDPVARLLDLRPGQVVEATYPSINSGTHREFLCVA